MSQSTGNLGQIAKLIGIGFGLALLLVVAVGFLLPSHYTIERVLVVEAAPAQIHELAGDLEQWPRWTPWLRDDPSLVVTQGDQSTGKGAQLAWENKTGGGDLIFTRSQADWGLAFDLTLGKRKRLSACSIRYRVIQQGTEITWQLQGDAGMDILSRYFNLMLDPLMGPMLEDGLEQIKVLAEDSPQDESGNPAG